LYREPPQLSKKILAKDRRFNLPFTKAPAVSAGSSKVEYLSNRDKQRAFRNSKSSHFGFKRVFGRDAKAFFADCEENCACLEEIFGTIDLERDTEREFEELTELSPISLTETSS